MDSHDQNQSEEHQEPITSELSLRRGPPASESLDLPIILSTIPVLNPAPEQQPPSAPDSDSPICSVCRDTLSPNIAKAIPCQHEFDLACIRLVLEMNGTRGRQCPLCRTRIEEVHHTFKDDGTFIIETPDATRPESPLASGPYIHQDEELTEDMTIEQRQRILELRRLRRIDDYYDFTEITKLFWAVEGGEKPDTTAGRFLALKVEQREGVTTYELRRELNITYPSSNEDRPGMILSFTRLNEEESPELIEEAKQEILDAFGSVHAPRPWAELEVKQPRYEVECDENRLMVVANKCLTVADRGTPRFAIQTGLKRVTKISETFLGQAPIQTNVDMFPTLTSEAKAKVKLAREEIEGVIEAMGILHGPSWAEPGLQMSATGVRWTPSDQGADWQGCEYCGKDERNGDCLIPWALLRNGGRFPFQSFKLDSSP